ncbi:hypothetical protein NYE54_16725 [Paenibacillus sp. FSL K6-1330]|uniref:hypothetical protein n=1 Tax=Paenibacillus sp. FSL K6-1330 TaxID=2975292 RepID=UPI0030D7BAE4
MNNVEIDKAQYFSGMACVSARTRICSDYKVLASITLPSDPIILLTNGTESDASSGIAAPIHAENENAEIIEGIELVSKSVYRLPNGEHVQGKKNAEKAYQEYLASLEQKDDEKECGDSDVDQSANS